MPAHPLLRTPMRINCGVGPVINARSLDTAPGVLECRISQILLQLTLGTLTNVIAALLARSRGRCLVA
jgi:hypothetical protein